jgi:mono/diheme cytochrome c family protein
MWRLSLVLSGLMITACEDRSREPYALGALVYHRHCASCHGPEGRGDGPLASSLREPPADLSQIEVRAGGRFDEGDVMSAIDGRRAVQAHGPREMPVWGAVFEEELRREQAPYPGITVLQQKRALADYLRTLQRGSGTRSTGE